MKKKIKKKVSKKTEKESNIKNIILIIGAIIVVIIVFLVSTKMGPNGNNIINNFSISEFENVTAVGLGEYKASFAHEGNSIFFFCSNEEEKCYDMLKDLNNVAKDNEIMIEYLNVLELVETEISELDNLLDKKGKSLYPTLLIIKDGEIKENINTYISKTEIKKIFTQNDLMKK